MNDEHTGETIAFALIRHIPQSDVYIRTLLGKKELLDQSSQQFLIGLIDYVKNCMGSIKRTREAVGFAGAKAVPGAQTASIITGAAAKIIHIDANVCQTYSNNHKNPRLE